jgi:tryptophan synthase alpha chain
VKRLERQFAALRGRGELALLPYVSIGFPSRELTAELAIELVRAGADGLELGIPFSDPLADGVTLQRVSHEALEAGITLADAFGTARTVRASTEAPLIFMSYYNPIQRRGLGQFCAAAAEAGIDGLIVPDLPLEETNPLREACAATGLALILMVAPTTPASRLAATCAKAEGFIYCVSLIGVTGARQALAQQVPALLARVRAYTSLPLVVGFGISRPEHVAALSSVADGAIVASALADLLEKAAPDQRLRAGAEYIRSLKAACLAPHAATKLPAPP